MKQKVISILFIIYIVGFCVIGFTLKDKEVSTFERRKLAQMPELNSEFTQGLDEYIVDQFPLRNEFINLNSNINRNIFQIKDYNDVYVIEETLVEKNYPLSKKTVSNFNKKIKHIIQKDLQNSNVYYSIIPNKEYFLNDREYLKIDYNELLRELNIEGQYIDIMPNLSIEDYYKTDIHWKQQNLREVTKTLVENMKNDYNNLEYTYQKYGEFYGSSYSKAGIKMEPDELSYLVNEYTEKATVNHLEYGKKTVYDFEKANKVDMYDIYLSGASSLIEITNPISISKKQLIIFRDSFASSLVPLLIPYYSNIILIDLRYINYDIASQMLDFSNKDVLFIYSAEIINNSQLLKVNI